LVLKDTSENHPLYESIIEATTLRYTLELNVLFPEQLKAKLEVLFFMLQKSMTAHYPHATISISQKVTGHPDLREGDPRDYGVPRPAA
jgi:hypothetical protein